MPQPTERPGRPSSCSPWSTPSCARSPAGWCSADRRQTLQPTELIHEAYLRLVDQPDSQWDGRLHFQRVAARAMRFVLVDRARARLAEKRGGGQRPATLDDAAAAVDDAQAVLGVHDGLDKLRRDDPQLADIVELRFFGGLDIDEAAAVLGISASTVKRGWRTARAWWVEEIGE